MAVGGEHSMDDDAIQAAVRSSLQDVKAGDNFAPLALGEHGLERLQEGDDEALNRFLQFAAIHAVLSTEQRKEAHSILETLHSQREKWLKEIQEYNNAVVVKMEMSDEDGDSEEWAELAQHILGRETGMAKIPKAEPEPDVDSFALICTTCPVNTDHVLADTDVEIESDGSLGRNARMDTQMRSKKRRRLNNDLVGQKLQDSNRLREVSPPTKKKAPMRARKKSGPLAVRLAAAREAAKMEFEAEKARIVAELPEEYTKLWGQVGYAKWGKQWLPCLIVGPFDVGAGTNMRKAWMSMFENTRNRRHQMTNLIFWYGQSDFTGAFSLVPQKDFVAYDEGVEKGHDKLPNKIKKKLDSEKGLSRAEHELVAAHEELNADLLRHPEERVSFDGFHELYEDDDYVRSLLDVEDSDDEFFSSDNDENLVSSASSSSELESDSDDNDEKVAQPRPSEDTHSQNRAPKVKKETSEYIRNQLEMKKFCENEMEFLPTLEKWKAAIKNEYTNGIDEVLQSIVGRVHLMGAPFMEAYELSPLMTATKKLLRERNADRTMQKKLKTKLGEQHKTQKALVPASFALPKSRKLDKKTGG